MHHMHQDSLVSRPPAPQPAQLTDPASLGTGLLGHYMRVLCPLCLPHACVSMHSSGNSSEMLYMVELHTGRTPYWQNTRTAKAQHYRRLSAAVSMQVDYASVCRSNALPAML